MPFVYTLLHLIAPININNCSQTFIAAILIVHHLATISTSTVPPRNLVDRQCAGRRSSAASRLRNDAREPGMSPDASVSTLLEVIVVTLRNGRPGRIEGSQSKRDGTAVVRWKWNNRDSCIPFPTHHCKDNLTLEWYKCRMLRRRFLIFHPAIMAIHTDSANMVPTDFSPN